MAVIFDLEDRLLQLAKKLVFHESPAPAPNRRIDTAGTRTSLKPDERRADDQANRAMASLKGSEKGPQPVNRAKQLIDTPGSPGLDQNVWRRAEAAQASTAAPLNPAQVQRLSEALGHDVSGINVHTDANADEICRAANSQVVARGRDVFFRRGSPLPGTPQGDQLLSHAIEQLSVDARTAGDDQPLRRFMENEPNQAPAPEVEEPKKSGWGLLGLVGAAVSAKKAYDSTKADEPEATTDQAALDEVKADASTEQQLTPKGPGDMADATATLEGDRSELAEQERKVREVQSAAEAQQADKDRLPDSPVVDEQREALAETAATAAALADSVREAKSDKADEPVGEENEEQESSVHEVAAELGLQAPFNVAGDYETRYERPASESESDEIDVQDHRLLMEVDVDNAAEEFETDAFGGDLALTVDRIVELVDDQLQDQVNDVSGPERDQLRDQIDHVTPQLPEVIEQQVREAAEYNTSEEQEELQLELEQEQVGAEGEQAQQAETFAFGARIDLQTGQVVVTTNDSLPGTIESAVTSSAPTTSTGDGGGGGGGSGGGGGDGGGGGGGAPAA